MPALAEEAKQQKQIMLAKNPLYEYHTEMIRDIKNGIIDITALDNMLTIYANEGWRLHSVIVNESGKNSSSLCTNIARDGGMGGWLQGGREVTSGDMARHAATSFF
jgi:hypothetical protein